LYNSDRESDYQENLLVILNEKEHGVILEENNNAKKQNRRKESWEGERERHKDSHKNNEESQ
jgi:hypothetical protein